MVRLGWYLALLVPFTMAMLGCQQTPVENTLLSTSTARPLTTGTAAPNAQSKTNRTLSANPTPSLLGILTDRNSTAGAGRRYGRRSPFVPLDDPVFLSEAESSYFPDNDLVLGLYENGTARAYPIRMLTYHHIVNDTVAERAILITY